MHTCINNVPLSAVACFPTRVLSIITFSTSPECLATVKVSKMPLSKRICVRVCRGYMYV